MRADFLPVFVGYILSKIGNGGFRHDHQICLGLYGLVDIPIECLFSKLGVFQVLRDIALQQTHTEVFFI